MLPRAAACVTPPPLDTTDTLTPYIAKHIHDVSLVAYHAQRVGFRVMPADADFHAAAAISRHGLATPLASPSPFHCRVSDAAFSLRPTTADATYPSNEHMRHDSHAAR